MSLKSFHILFVSVAIVLTLGFGAWSMTEAGQTAGSTSFLGSISLVIGVLLVIYEAWFLKAHREFES